MEIEILHIEDCPNWAEAGRRVRAVLDRTGHAHVEVRHRLLRTSEEAIKVRFAGSPTILVDGDDLFPSGERTDQLACRLYRTGDGLAGLPTPEQLVEALASR